jgi:hypothetical protein
MREATSDLLIFVDEDNVLEPDFLFKAISIKQDWARLGVWGIAQLFQNSRSSPPRICEGFYTCSHFGDVNSARWSNVIPCAGATPFGAGQCYAPQNPLRCQEAAAAALWGGPGGAPTIRARRFYHHYGRRTGELDALWQIYDRVAAPTLPSIFFNKESRYAAGLDSPLGRELRYIIGAVPRGRRPPAVRFRGELRGALSTRPCDPLAWCVMTSCSDHDK